MTYTPDDYGEPSGWVRTGPGRRLDPADPQPERIHLSDIAQGLSRLCRFNGHVEGTFYSVAEHSLHVAAQLWRTYGIRELALCGLFHDASEAYLGDVIRPVKQLLPEYRVIEERMMEAIRQRFDLPGADCTRVWETVKEADEAILPWEMAMVRDCAWRRPADMDAVRQAFVDKARELGGSRVLATPTPPT